MIFFRKFSSSQKKQFIIAFLLVAFSNCYLIEVNQEYDSNPEILMSEVKQMLKDYNSEFKKNGLTAAFKYLDQLEKFIWVTPGYTTQLSYDSVESILTENTKVFSTLEFEWDSLKIYPLGENMHLHWNSHRKYVGHSSNNLQSIDNRNRGFG